MSIKEQIRAEVERLEKHYLVREYDNGWDDALDAISKFLDTIPEQSTGETSDGFHTFDELYYYRMLYNAAFFNLLPKEWVHKSKRHHAGEECFGGGWFIVVANLPTGQISNHYELKYWDLFKIPEKEFADEWDGHTPQEAAKRLHEYLRQEQPMGELEEEISRTYNDCSVTDTEEIGHIAYENIARHFAEWGAEHARKEQPVEGLEEELKRYINSDEYINTRENGTLLIARHFAEWAQNTRKKTKI